MNREEPLTKDYPFEKGRLGEPQDIERNQKTVLPVITRKTVFFHVALVVVIDTISRNSRFPFRQGLLGGKLG